MASEPVLTRKTRQSVAGVARVDTVKASDGHVVVYSQPGTELLGSRLLARRRYEEDDAKIVFRQMVEAVKALHSVRAVHGWLNPDSFLMASTKSDLHVLLSDFAFVQVLHDASLVALFRHHAKFAAPELITKFRQGFTAAQLSPAVDVWGLGVSLYMLLSGVYPFGDGVDMSLNILKARCNWEHVRWKTVSGEAKRLVGRLLVANPEERIKIDELLQHPWLAGVVVPSLPSGGTEVEPERVPSQIVVLEPPTNKAEASGEPVSKKAKTSSSVSSATAVAAVAAPARSTSTSAEKRSRPEEEEQEAPAQDSKKRPKGEAPKASALKKLKVADLRAKCTELGISSAGTKDQMVARILELYDE